MVIRGTNWIYVFLLLAVTFVPVIFRDLSFEGRLFVHDFSQEGIFRKFTYHFSLMAQPTILCWIIFTHAKGFWKVVSLVSFLWFFKDCADVVYCNNSTGTFWFDFIAYSLIIIIIFLCLKFAMKK